MEFKVGDKVRVIAYDHHFFDKGHEFVVDRVGVDGYVYDENNICILKHRVELVTSKQSKKQRIEALEKYQDALKDDIKKLEETTFQSTLEIKTLQKENAELKERIEALEQAEKQRYIVGVDVAKEVHKTPNLDIDLSDLPKETYIKHEGKLYKKVNREAQVGDVVVFDNVEHKTKRTKDGQPYLVYEDKYNTLRYDNGHEYGNQVYGWERNCPIPDVYEPLEQLKTPNQQRAEIIEKAKGFVEENTNKLHILVPLLEKYHIGESKTAAVDFRFDHECQFINEKDSRTVVCLIRCKYTSKIYHKGIAKCSPTDVFNIHIGKAIALGRALGKDVSEFVEAVQPTEVVVGMNVKSKNHDKTFYAHGFHEDEKLDDKYGRAIATRGINDPHWIGTEQVTILDDTNAVYEVEQ